MASFGKAIRKGGFVDIDAFPNDKSQGRERVAHVAKETREILRRPKIIVEAAQTTRCCDFGQIASPAGFQQEFSVAFSFR